MRKKLLALLLVGAVAATSIIGFTACDDSNNDSEENGVEEETPAEELQKGEEVTEEQWKAAIAATAAAGNLTVNAYYEEIKVATKPDDASVNCTVTATEEKKIYIDLGNSKFYEDAFVVEKSTGTETIGEDEIDNEYPLREYGTVDDTTLWFSVYSEAEDDTEEDAEGEWWARSHVYDSAEKAKEGLADYSNDLTANWVLSITLSETADGDEVPLSDAYSLFEYEDGFYTASVYRNAVAAGILMELTVSIRDGYVTVFKQKYTKELTDDDLNITQTKNYEYTFGSFGTTVVNAPEGAVAAVEAAIEAAKPPVLNSVVAGKTFVFDSVEFEYDNSVSEYDKKQYESTVKPQLEAMNTGYTIVFDNDWGCTMPEEKVAGTYTEDGNVITFTRVSVDGYPAPADPHDFTLSGNKLTISETQDGVTIKMIYTVQA